MTEEWNKIQDFEDWEETMLRGNIGEGSMPILFSNKEEDNIGLCSAKGGEFSFSTTEKTWDFLGFPSFILFRESTTKTPFDSPF